MRKPSIPTLTTCALLAATVTASVMLPDTLSVPFLAASAPPEEIRLTTLIRDFKSSHADFDVVPASGLGHCAGTVASALGDDGRPALVEVVDDFNVSSGGLVPGEPFAAQATVLGAVLLDGASPVPVTLQVHADAAALEPFGTYDYITDTTGDVNDGANPRSNVFTLDQVYAPGTVLAIEATSWETSPAGNLGYTTVMSQDRSDAEGQSVATQITVPTDGVITSITAYLNSGDDAAGEANNTRYALYADSGGEPGALLAQTAEVNATPGWHWFTIDLPDTAVSAGTYWLALAQNLAPQQYRMGSNNGQTRVSSHRGLDGFQATWSNTVGGGPDRVSIYAAFTPNQAQMPHMTVDAGSASPYVYVLRKNDPVPAIPAMADLATIHDFVEPYVDLASGLMTLEDNQAIYLFELGTTNLASPDADFQDLVVLVTLASDPIFFNGGSGGSASAAAGFKVDAQWVDSAGRNIAPHLYVPIGTDNAGNPLADAPGVEGVADDGGIATDTSFAQWFNDLLGVNQSTSYPLTLVRNDSGVYEYLEPYFHPIDGALFGNEGESHNHYFTLAFNAQFTYDQSGGQFIEFSGGDGAWLFVNEKLMLDLGGMRSGVAQYLSMDRLSMVDGNTYELHFFYAQRDAYSTDFNFRTNIELSGGELLGFITKPFD
ncbi:MAG: fibro-slime domain-containing protein [Planctomycetota bacterium]|jgi:fibro-slime domain-containing protein